jgi:hypothetical protein
MSKRLVLNHPLDSSPWGAPEGCESGASHHCFATSSPWPYCGRGSETVEVNEKTIREWVAAFNAGGVASLRYERHKGRIPHLTPGRESELAEAIRKGPPPEMKIEVWCGWALRQ